MTNIGQNEFLKLYDIIKSDNLTSFCLLYENNKQLLKFSFGRFPILSICYLYHSKKIISKFEKAMCKIKDFIIIDEPFLLYRDFRSICGHLIKVYANQTSFVMPLEMKAILHKDGFVKKNFAEFAKSAETCNNLTAIYNLSNQKCIIADKKIKISAKKLSKKAKKAILFSNLIGFSTIALCFVVTAIIALTVGFGTAAFPKKVYSANQLMRALSRGTTCISLQNDIKLNSSFTCKNFTGTINGNNNTITIDYDYTSSLFDSFDGKVTDLNIVNKDDNIEITDDLSLFCKTNNGSIENLKISYNGAVNFNGTNNSTFFSGIVVDNYGTIKNCSANFILTAQNSNNKDAYASAICSINYNEIASCAVLEDSSIETTNVDACGICIYNSYAKTVSTCENNASITQNVTSSEWSPTMSGIVLNNVGTIDNCINKGNLQINISEETTKDTCVIIGGICASNYARVYHSKNTGNVSATCKNLMTYGGGICGYVNTNGAVNNPTVDSCISDCELSFTKDDDVWLYCGGIAGYMRGTVTRCCSASTFTNQFNKEKKVMSALMIGVTLYNYTYSFESGITLVKNLHLVRQSNCFLQSEITTNIVAVAFLANDSNYDDVNNENNMYGSDIAEDDSQIFITKYELEQNDLYW